MRFSSFTSVAILIASCFLSGCSMAAKLATGGNIVTVPQFVAHLEPVLRDNKIFLSGNIIIQNPTRSSLGLEQIRLQIRDEDENILEKNIIEWDKATVASRTILKAPVQIGLDLAALNNRLLSVDLQTAFTYKRFGIRIPVENKIAVLHLDFLKQSIIRPFDVIVYTKFRSNIFGRASIEYVLDITNPVGLDLLLENGQIFIYSGNREIARSTIVATLFKTGKVTRIKGTIDLKNIFKKIVTYEFVKRNPLRFKMSGDLKVPKTDIAMPFKVESIQTVDFSWFGK